jgi:molybdate transport system substrate-binding protein
MDLPSIRQSAPLARRRAGAAFFAALNNPVVLVSPGLSSNGGWCCMLLRLLLLIVLCVAPMIGNGASAEELRVLAAGSLGEAMDEVGNRYKAATGTTITAEFGPSGLLRERIEKGEHADLLASADMGHPLKLLQDGRAIRVAMFTRNTLCGMAVSRVGLTTANFLERLIDPAVKLGTSTPKADPSGDYTWAMFRRADTVRPGSYEILSGKAQQIVGGPSTSAPAGGKDPIVAALAAGRIDVMISYCSGAKSRLGQMAELQVAEVPREIAAGPEYGLAVLKGANPKAADFALYILSPDGQQVLSRHGFAPIGLPTPER